MVFECCLPICKRLSDSTQEDLRDSTDNTNVVGVEAGRELIGVKFSSLLMRFIEGFFSRLAKGRSGTVLQEPLDRSCSGSVP